MGTAPDTLLRLVGRFDLGRKVFLSSDYKEEQLPKAKTPHEAEALQRQTAAADRQIDLSVYELYGLTEEEVSIVEGEGNGTPGICGMPPNCEGG